MYSKIPVYDGEIDRMIGVLQVKRLVLEARKKSFDQLDLRELLQPAYFVPENRRTDILFKEMQAGNEKLAVLVDEYGGVSGMVTLEDLIEEIVGDIREEYEEEEPEINEVEPHKVYRVQGGSSLFDLREKFHLKAETPTELSPDIWWSSWGISRPRRRRLSSSARTRPIMKSPRWRTG